VPELTAVASRQMKQVRLLDRLAVPVQVFYGADLVANKDFEGMVAQRTLRTKNDTAHHLGLPLPSGQLAAFVARREASLLLNEAPLRDVAVGEEFEMALGDSPDVQIRTVLEQTNIDPANVKDLPLIPGVLRLHEAVVDDVSRVEIFNARSSAIPFELRLSLPAGAQLIAAKPAPTTYQGRPLFRLTIPAGGSATIRYRTEHVSRSTAPVP
jgi:hypothetical protein